MILILSGNDKYSLFIQNPSVLIGVRMCDFVENPKNGENFCAFLFLQKKQIKFILNKFSSNVETATRTTNKALCYFRQKIVYQMCMRSPYRDF